MKKINSISDLQFDDNNANKGSEIGAQRLEDSLRHRGAGRSVLADKNGKLIAGNKTVEKAAELGMEIQVVPTRGDKLIVVMREDLDLDTDDSARVLAYEDNRIGQLDLVWDVEQISADALQGVDIDHLFSDEYIASLLARGIDEDERAEQTFGQMQEAKDQVVTRKVCCPECGVFFTPDRYYDGIE